MVNIYHFLFRRQNIWQHQYYSSARVSSIAQRFDLWIETVSLTISECEHQIDETLDLFNLFLFKIEKMKFGHCHKWRPTFKHSACLKHYRQMEHFKRRPRPNKKRFLFAISISCPNIFIQLLSHFWVDGIYSSQICSFHLIHILGEPSKQSIVRKALYLRGIYPGKNHLPYWNSGWTFDWESIPE